MGTIRRAPVLQQCSICLTDLVLPSPYFEIWKAFKLSGDYFYGAHVECARIAVEDKAKRV
jgi:hypothetical protein